MKIPEEAPDWITIDWHQIPMSENIPNVVQKANKEYLYWDKIKYIAPEGIKKEHLWALIKTIRELNMRPIPLSNGKGNPFKFWLPNSALEYLHEIGQNAGGIIVAENPSIYASEKKLYLMKSIVEEAIASSQIEGAVTTRQVAKEMLQTGRKPKDRSEQMVYNSYLTISKIKSFIDQPLSDKLLKDLQGSMTKDTLDNPDHSGRFRHGDDEPISIYNYEGDVMHTPPPSEHIEALVDDLCSFANKTGGEFIHPVIKAIILHFWLAYIHPFNDGNGRTARALFYWYMLKNKYWLFEYLSISRVIVKARTQYYRSFLYSEIDNGDMTYFILFHLRAISAALKDLKRYIERKQTELSHAAIQWKSYQTLNYRQKDVLRKALENKGLTFALKSHMQKYNVVHQTARTDFLELCEAGLFRRFKQGNKHFFIPAEDLDKKLI
ncbi:MAG TPA: Fic family protein [Syntrophorhabdaceae bacterium]|nr:Fic family protein [Syntrophorhabdaceae bacterium]